MDSWMAQTIRDNLFAIFPLCALTERNHIDFILHPRAADNRLTLFAASSVPL